MIKQCIVYVSELKIKLLSSNYFLTNKHNLESLSTNEPHNKTKRKLSIKLKPLHIHTNCRRESVGWFHADDDDVCVCVCVYVLGTVYDSNSNTSLTGHCFVNWWYSIFIRNDIKHHVG